MTERGQYITLLCLQHQKGHLSGKLIALAVGDAAADVMAKFRQDPAGLWYNARLDNEIQKRKIHTEKQRERAVEGWKKRKSEAAEDTTANAVALPLENVIENENRNVIETKGVQGEKISDEWFDDIFDSMNLGAIKSTFPDHDIPNELSIFKLKVRGSPGQYLHRDSGSIRQAFIYQLSKSNGKRNTTKTSIRRADATIEGTRDFGKL